ncbi:unnamed protein product [Clonostachys rosea]|uniref:Carboxylesterase type B domain-containing protein n=1 Tax=Bionectria ochroleuca TaxID=29856 RepID=A0ABY6UMG1_BIOOC|nr:unnamed protein product [Clonostachys rosea]
MRSSFSLVALGALLGLTRALEDLPVITLPWGKYRAEVFGDDEEILLFRNVRFGKEPPRFGAPSFPDWEDGSIQSPDRSTTCIQINPKKLSHPPAGGNPLEDPHKSPAAQTEDCLFLDIYVPRWVYEEQDPSTLLPVTVWIYGGGFAFGSKNQGGPLYTGKSALQASNYNSIFVTGNYRVGAFGWLAGDYMQQEGQPNAGLYDQALLFEWVQTYINQARGDNASVSAWGESAGAGSILHHLIREDGEVDPKFHTFAAQSPGFEWAWDNSPGGKLDTMYRNFSRLAGCDFDYNIDCLRKAPVAKLADANQNLFDLVRQTGLFPVGPAVDGKWIKNLSPISFSEDKYWKNITSGLISHVANEGYLFSPKDMDSEAKYDAFLNEFLPGSTLAPQRTAIKAQYDCKKTWLGDYRLCVAAIIAHAVFTCNTRDLATAYPGKSYMMDYAFPADGLAYHGSDLVPQFVTNATETEKLLEALDIEKYLIDVMAPLIDNAIKPVFQNYFASFGLYGSPDSLGARLPWPTVVDDGDEFSDVMKVGLSWGSPFKVGSDSKNSKAKCSFWSGIAKEIVASKATYGDSHGGLFGTQYPINGGNEL